MSRLFRRLPAARRPASRNARLLVRPLEGRIVPAAFTVANTNDAGSGSLRQAILDANANPGADTIGFDPAAFGSAQTISLLTALPTISDSVSITGPGSGLLTVRRDPAAASAFAVLTFSGSGTLAAVSGLTVSGGTAGGIENVNGNLTLTDLTVRSNVSAAGGSGGGIQSTSG
ncbi:MAG TPA: hypothetical protein VGF55_33805, partial [Gemmataceae bacterium]